MTSAERHTSLSMKRAERRARVEHLIRTAISDLHLDLSEISILTEAASGYFAVTSLIAALAGADHVYAVTRDSPHGTADEVKEYIESWAADLNIGDRVHVTTSPGEDFASEVQIVTNLGFVRPIDWRIIERLPYDAAISLMSEPWEIRARDVDIHSCRSRNIPVLATNETHMRLQIFSYVGLIALKLLLETDVEVYRSRVLVVGTEPFGSATSGVLMNNGCEVVLLQPTQLSSLLFRAGNFDAVVLVEHRDRQTLVGTTGLIDPNVLVDMGTLLVHICGVVDDTSIAESGLRKVPNITAQPGYMTLTTAYVGPRPVVDLHTAGLRVGEIAVRELRRSRNRVLAEEEAVRSGLAARLDNGLEHGC